MQRPRLALWLTALLLFLPAGTVRAWDAIGHQLIARIAWDQLTPATKTKVIALLQTAPDDACLLGLFPNDARPLDVREREFFVRSSTWPDLVRPASPDDTRPCIRFHHADWHFINFFWEGISGATDKSAPRDRDDIAIPPINGVERVTLFRSNPPCATGSCDPPAEERPMLPAWIIHIVGDLHQPLHTSARVTTRTDELQGDRGGGRFNLGTAEQPFSLHSYWDGIVKFSIRRKQGESEHAYVERLAAQFAAQHPPSAFSGRLQPGDVKAWSLEGFVTTKATIYPATLQRGQLPDEQYRTATLAHARQAIALAGYRLADLLNALYGS
jgi:S1/P1 nuclease